VLVVCTANICRSPLAERLIATQLADDLGVGLNPASFVLVRSAGTYAEPGDPMCPQSAARLGVDPMVHRARLVQAGVLATADLVVTADRGHRGVCARTWPECRPRLFTLTQAAALADQIAASLATGVIPQGAPPMPEGAGERLRWLVSEMDAARGSLAGIPDGYEDIVDNHVSADHALTLAQTEKAAVTLAEAMLVAVVAAGPVGEPGR